MKSILIAAITNHAGRHHVDLQIDEVDLPLNTNVGSRLILNASSDTDTQSRSGSNCRIKRRISNRFGESFVRIDETIAFSIGTVDGRGKLILTSGVATIIGTRGSLGEGETFPKLVSYVQLYRTEQKYGEYIRSYFRDMLTAK